MQPLSAPIGSGKQGDREFRKVGHARTVIIVDQSPPWGSPADIGTILPEFVIRERRGSRDRLAGNRVARPPVAHAILHAQDLAVVPIAEEIAKDAAMAGELP